MEDPLQIRRVNEIPSSEEFSSQIETKNVPVLFSGCVKGWKALSKWDVSNGGFDYLQELVGSSVVEAMISRSAPVFYGDIRSHERVPLPFSTFIGYCKNLLQNEVDDFDSSEKKRDRQDEVAPQHGDSLVKEEAPEQIYLAQVPILNAENEEKVQLECLKEDIETPAFLMGKMLSAVNLWMNNARSRSSTHYDPHHNLLCIISGCKQVILWPPSASPLLYPLPLYGEASNHSAVSLDNPDFALHPRANCLNEYSQKVTLHAGDALFIPEGWFHQVDSESLTIAVNFWWQSDMVSGMLEHMDAYYLRRILRRLMDKEMDRMLSTASTADKIIFSSSISSNENADLHAEVLDRKHPIVRQRQKLDQRFMLHDLEPYELQSLHELVSLIHDRVDNSQSVGKISSDQSLSGEENEVKKVDDTHIFNLEKDPIADIVWGLEPCTFQRIFLVMAHNFPRTVEAFILHALTAVGTEVLTRKFEQMDKMITADDRSEFYETFYSVFDNQFSAMDVLLNGKELFARQAFKNVLVQYVGITFDGPKASLG